MTRQEEMARRLDVLEQQAANFSRLLDTLGPLREKVTEVEETCQDSATRVGELDEEFRVAIAALREESRLAVEGVRDGLDRYATAETVEELRQQVTLLTRAIANPPANALAPTTHPKVPEPKSFTGVRDAKMLENFIFDMEQYFAAIGQTNERTKVSIATMFLTGDAKLWWRTKYDQIQNGVAHVDTWAELRTELRTQFFPENVEYNARKKLRELRQGDDIRRYVREFSALMLDIKSMSEDDKLFYFLEGLNYFSRNELQRQRVANLTQAQAAAEHLTDNTNGTKGKSVSPGHDSRKSNKLGKPKSGGAPSSSSHSGGGGQKKFHGSHQIAKNEASSSGKKPTFTCFLCNGPHKVAECPHKAALNAITKKAGSIDHNEGSERGR